MTATGLLVLSVLLVVAGWGVLLVSAWRWSHEARAEAAELSELYDETGVPGRRRAAVRIIAAGRPRS